jgi:formylmethanofuran dehydrogenase subunit E
VLNPYILYRRLLIFFSNIEMSGEKEETAEERSKRWMDREAQKADELKPKEGKCSRCGKEVKEGEYIEFQGRILCAECYADALEESVDIGSLDSCGGG